MNATEHCRFLGCLWTIRATTQGSPSGAQGVGKGRVKRPPCSAAQVFGGVEGKCWVEKTTTGRVDGHDQCERNAPLLYPQCCCGRNCSSCWLNLKGQTPMLTMLVVVGESSKILCDVYFDKFDADNDQRGVRGSLWLWRLLVDLRVASPGQRACTRLWLRSFPFPDMPAEAEQGNEDLEKYVISVVTACNPYGPLVAELNDRNKLPQRSFPLPAAVDPKLNSVGVIEPQLHRNNSSKVVSKPKFRPSPGRSTIPLRCQFRMLYPITISEYWSTRWIGTPNVLIRRASGR